MRRGTTKFKIGTHYSLELVISFTLIGVNLLLRKLIAVNLRDSMRPSKMGPSSLHSRSIMEGREFISKPVEFNGDAWLSKRVGLGN